jgi:hypothetical protein
MSGTAFGGEITRVTTTQELPLGFQVTVPDGDFGMQKWTYVKAVGAALAIGDICNRDLLNITLLYAVEPTGSGAVLGNMAVVGVAQHAIASGSFGFVLSKGKGLVKNGSANITTDNLITSGGDRVGAAIVFAGGVEECVIGIAMETENTNDTTFDAYLNCPGA